MHVAIVGGSGRLGSWMTRFLVNAGHRVRVADTTPPAPLPGQDFVPCDLRTPQSVPVRLLEGCDAVLHLAALHGAHLVGGTPRRMFWPVNVRGTQAILESALACGVRRFVLASSTSVYGAGSATGAALVLHELTPVAPEDVYDLSKVAAERLALCARTAGLDAVALRFGRFFFPSHTDYHLRKLSTGLDVRDCCQAIVRVLLAPAITKPVYCVASDLPLCHEQRSRLGIDAVEVLREAVPELVTAAQRRGVPIPHRVGKSVTTDTIRADLGYAPERALDWVARMWDAVESAPDPAGLAARYSRALAADQ